MIDMTRHQLNFRVGADLLDRLKLVSDSQNLSVSGYSIKALEYCLDNQISFIPSGDRSQSPPIDMDILGSVRECQQANNHAIESRLVAIESRLVAIESRLDPVTVEMLDSQLDNDSVVNDPVAVEMLDNPLDNDSVVNDPVTVEMIDSQLDNDSVVNDPVTVEMIDSQLDNDSVVNDPVTVEMIDSQLDNDSVVSDPVAVEMLDSQLDNDSVVNDPVAVEMLDSLLDRYKESVITQSQLLEILDNKGKTSDEELQEKLKAKQIKVPGKKNTPNVISRVMFKNLRVHGTIFEPQKK